MRPFVYYTCQKCDSEYISPRPTDAEILSFYPDNYGAYHDDFGAVTRKLVGIRNWGRARYYGRLVGRRTARIFDVGTGDCRHFESLRRYGDFSFSGIEIKPEMAASAQGRGYHVIPGTLETMDLSGHEGRYDIVSIYHVLEHVTDPRLAVRRAKALLRPGGWFIGQLPCRDSWERKLFGRYWVGYHYPRHLQVFSRRGVRHLLEEAGFCEVRVLSVPHLSTAISIQNTLIGRGWKLSLRFGRSRIFRGLLGAVAPFEMAAYVFGRCGIVNFRGQKPPRVD